MKTRTVTLAAPLAVAAALCLFLGCQPPASGPTIDAAAMQALAERSMQIVNEGRLELCDEIYAADFVRHTVEQGDIVGPGGMKELVTQLRTGFPDVVATTDDVIVAPDAVVTLWTETGTQTGPFADVPPTGRQVQLSGVTVSRVANGKIVEEWVYYNALPVWQQLGYTLTAPAEPPME